MRLNNFHQNLIEFGRYQVILYEQESVLFKGIKPHTQTMLYLTSAITVPLFLIPANGLVVSWRFWAFASLSNSHSSLLISSIADFFTIYESDTGNAIAKHDCRTSSELLNYAARIRCFTVWTLGVKRRERDLNPRDLHRSQAFNMIYSRLAPYQARRPRLRFYSIFSLY